MWKVVGVVALLLGIHSSAKPITDPLPSATSKNYVQNNTIVIIKYFFFHCVAESTYQVLMSTNGLVKILHYDWLLVGNCCQ